ncbi:MAG TPA: hypothetical protein VKV73_27785 [Chloroflexota bacterium]|nr:hypothetical protein [Chloroflexota bacterium]
MAARIGNNLDWWEAHWEERAFLEPLLALQISFSAMAVCLVTLGHGVQRAGRACLAAEVTARAGDPGGGT